MLGGKERGQLELFVSGSLRQLIPDDHLLTRVDRVLDLSWLREEVAGLYCDGNGRPGIDPEVAVRLMLAGFLLGIVHDRRLMREAQVNIAIRWFAGYGLHETLPDHSSLTRIRQRWGPERFRRIFERTVRACLNARIAKGEIVHIDASLIRADVSWESLAVRYVEASGEANAEAGGEAEKKSRQTGKYKKVCPTDPDATMATNARNRRLEPAYKQHTAVDDLRGVILDVAVTTGEVNEGQVIERQIDATMATTGVAIATVTADAGYAYAKVYGALERQRIDALIPTKAEPIKSAVPLRRFRYDTTSSSARAAKSCVPAGGQARPLLLRTRPGLFAMFAGALLPVQGPGQQGARDRRRLSRPPQSPPTARPLVLRRSPSLPAPSLALGRLSRRGEDLARSRPRRPPRSRQHAYPGLPHRSRDQPEAARRSYCAVVGDDLDANGRCCARSRPSRLIRSSPITEPQGDRCRSRCLDPGFFNSPRVHFMRNALAHAGKSGRRVVSAFIATAFAQDDADAAKAQWRKVADQLRPTHRRLATFMDEAETDVCQYR